MLQAAGPQEGGVTVESALGKSKARKHIEGERGGANDVGILVDCSNGADLVVSIGVRAAFEKQGADVLAAVDARPREPCVAVLNSGEKVESGHRCMAWHGMGYHCAISAPPHLVHQVHRHAFVQQSLNLREQSILACSDQSRLALRPNEGPQCFEDICWLLRGRRHREMALISQRCTAKVIPNAHLRTTTCSARPIPRRPFDMSFLPPLLKNIFSSR